MQAAEMLKRRAKSENIRRVDRAGTNVFNSNDMQSMHDSLNSEFILYQLILRIVLKQNDNKTRNQPTLYEHFQPDNEQDQQTMTEFDRTYKPNQAIHWYTRETCIYRMLNKALRTLHVDHILGFGLLIHDIYRQLSHEQVSFIRKLPKPILTVYRGQFISKDELIRMKSSTGQLIAMNSFLSTSTNHEEALKFITSSPPPTDTLASILLEINVYATNLARPCADIKLLSAFQKEEEILFAFGCVFRIDRIVEDKAMKIWKVYLTLCGDHDDDLRACLSMLDKDVDEKDQLVALGRHLLRMQKFDESETYYETLLDNRLITDECSLAACYHGLAQVNIKKGDNDMALKNLKTALEYLQKKPANEDHILVSQCYNNFGAAYLKKGDYLQSLRHYNQALITKNNDPSKSYAGLADVELQLGNYKLALEYEYKCLEGQLNGRRSLLGNTYRHIGKIYALLNDKQAALAMFHKSIEIQVKALGAMHPDLGYTYNSIGLMYLDLNDDKQAFKFIQKAFEIQIQSLPHNHLDFGETYRNFGNLYLKTGGLDKALSYFNQSLENQLTTFSEKHSSVCDTYILIGTVLLKKTNYDGALSYFHKTLDSYLERKRIGDPGLTEMYQLIGDTNLKKHDLDAALKYFHKLLDNELERKVPEDMSLFQTYQLIASIYCEKQHFRQALIYYYRMLDCQLQTRPFSESAIIDLYTEIGNIYLKKPFDQTFLQFDRLTHTETSEKARIDVSLLDTHTRIGNIHFEKRHLDQVYDYFQQLLDDQLKRLPSTDPSLTDIYAVLGNIAMEKHDIDKALAYFHQLLSNELQRKTSEDPSLADKYKVIGDIHLEKHDFDQALFHYNHFLDCQLTAKQYPESVFHTIYATMGKIYLETPLDKLLSDYTKSISHTSGNHKLSPQSNKISDDTDVKERHLNFVLQYFQQRLDDQCQVVPLDDASLIDTLKILGSTSFANHALEQASLYYQRLLENELQRKSPEDSSLVDTYRTIAKIYYERRQWDKTLINCHKLIKSELQRKALHDISFTDIYSMMALVYAEKQDFDHSLLYYDRLIGCHLQQIPVDKSRLDDVYVRIGEIYLKKKLGEILNRSQRLTDGPTGPRDSVHAQKKHVDQVFHYFQHLLNHSSNNPFSLLDLCKILAAISVERRDFDQSLIYLRKLSEENSKEHSMRTSSLIDLYKTLANLYCQKNDFDRGLMYVNQLLDCQLQRKSSDDTRLMEAYEILGKIHLNQQHHFFQTERSIGKLYENKTHQRPTMKDVDKVVQHVHFEKRHLSQSLVYFQQLLANQLKNLQWTHPSVLGTCTIIRNVFLNRGNFSDGVIYFQHLLDQQRKTNPHGDLSTANLYETIGHFYAEMGDFIRSERNYILALTIYKRHYSSAHPIIRGLKLELKRLSLSDTL